MRIDADYVDITGDGIVTRNEIWMTLSGPKLDVVPGEVASGLEIVVYDLFEDIFFHL
jgi:hypothetical protein